MERPKGPTCQSCGMPLARDEKGGGTEADGRTSTEYCSHCYQKGAFTMPGLTVDQMVSRVRGRLQQMGLPDPMIDKLAGEIPTLRRWRT